MSKWEPISTAPRDGSRVLCWRSDWNGGTFLVWKLNRRLILPEYRRLTDEEREWFTARSPSYFGNASEDDDYDLAIIGKGPTHWLPLQTPSGEQEQA